MNPTTPSGENITSTSPSSILREQLKTHESAYLRCKDRLPELLQQIADWTSERYPDPDSIGSRKIVRDIWITRVKGYTLLVDLCDKIDTNPFPGMQLMVTKVAVKLSPEVGRLRWLSIFQIYDIDATLRIYFPAEAVEFDLQSLEQKLLELAGDRDIVPVAEMGEVMPWVPNGKTYRAVKSALEDRGWRWKNVKRGGKQSKAIVVPSGYRVSAENSVSATSPESG
jgi:hypothetical protein